MSQSYNLDFLVIHFGLGGDLADKDGIPLPDCMLIWEEIPQQVYYEDLWLIIEEVSVGILVLLSTAFAVKGFSGYLLNSSLSMVWSVINGLQCVIHFPMLSGLLFPKLAKLVN